MKDKLKNKILIGCLGVLILFPCLVLAQYENVNNTFIVSPTKHEVRLSPGESIIRNIYITNRLGYDADFVVEIEDVSGSNVEDEVIKYYGRSLGPYSIRNYIMIENNRVNISAGKTRVIPVMISLPAGAKPGGFYGGVFVSLAKKLSTNGANLSSRIGSLIFLRVKGEAEEKGEVRKFGLFLDKKILWSRAPANFKIAFENQGNVYLNPYGVIEIKNWRGRVIDRLPIEPWFVFPDSQRTRLIGWDKLPLFGYFEANLILNHGYSVPQVTSLSYKFLIIPLPLILSLLVLVGLGFVIYKTVRKIKKWNV